VLLVGRFLKRKGMTTAAQVQRLLPIYRDIFCFLPTALVFGSAQKSVAHLNLAKGVPHLTDHLPQVLTEGEVVNLLRAVDNLKHRCILMLLYSAGLRLGKLVKLCLHDNPARTPPHLCAR